jgi:hypothetical protein
MDIRYMTKTKNITVVEKFTRLLSIMRNRASDEDLAMYSDIADRVAKLDSSKELESQISRQDKEMLNALWHKYKEKK